jgi:hypothetical protein
MIGADWLGRDTTFAETYWRQMKLAGITPNVECYEAIFDVLRGNKKQLARFEELWNEMTSVIINIKPSIYDFSEQ